MTKMSDALDSVASSPFLNMMAMCYISISSNILTSYNATEWWRHWCCQSTAVHICSTDQRRQCMKHAWTS